MGAKWHRAGSGHGNRREQGCCGAASPLPGCSGSAVGDACPHIPSPGPYRTRPLVFLSTEAAKLCVTPTRLVPSTSTMRSFTWILRTRGPSQRDHPLPNPQTPPSSPTSSSITTKRHQQEPGWSLGGGHPIPAVPVGRPSLRHRLDEDAQLLQAHVSPCTHADDADSQPCSICGDRDPCPNGAAAKYPAVTKGSPQGPSQGAK